MKVVATIFQCKRVSLPYFFIKYCVPKMRELSGFDIDVHLIQHINPGHNLSLKTCKDIRSKIENVQKWTEDGMFKGVNIIQHSDDYPSCPSVPSYKKGVEIFLKEKGDLHIWLEDDALILDKDPKQWINIKDVGVYSHWNFINTRHTIVTKNFDEKILETINTKEWNSGSFELTDERVKSNFLPLEGHPEYFMTACCTGPKLYLDEDGRSSFYSNYIAGEHCGFFNLELIKEIVPKEEIHFLKLDYDIEGV